MLNVVILYTLVLQLRPEFTLNVIWWPFLFLADIGSNPEF